MNNKHLTLYLSFLLLIAVGLASCSQSFLDPTVTTNLTKESVFSDSTYTAGFLNQIYADIGFDTNIDRFGDGGGLQVACDEAEYRQNSNISSGMMFATGTVNPITITTDAWEKCYRNIRRVNTFLANADNSPMVDATREQYKAEARFLRAWYYFILLRHYGGVPIIGDDVYESAEDERIKSVRDTYEDCVNYIVDQCQQIIDSRILRPRVTGRGNGRASEAACRSLIARVKLYAASPLYNGTDLGTAETQPLLGYATYDVERWKDAYDAAKAVLSMDGDYALYNYNENNIQTAFFDPGWGYWAIFFPSDFFNDHITDPYSGEVFPYGPYQEIIWEHRRGMSTTWHARLDPPTCGGNGTGGYVYKELVDAFPMKDGKPIGESKYAFDPIYPDDNRDGRFSRCVISNGDIVYNAGSRLPVYMYVGNGETEDAFGRGTQTGYYIRKYIHYNVSANFYVTPPLTQPLIRYAESLLNYAEAANEYFGPDFSETIGDKIMGVYQAIGLIRKRAGIEAGEDGLYGLKAGMSKDEMREAIQNERRIEFCFEGHRFFDVRRWKIADVTDNQTMHGLKITRAADGTLTSEEVPVRQHIFRPAMWFWPIPYDEIVKTPTLLQNPGYE